MVLSYRMPIDIPRKHAAIILTVIVVIGAVLRINALSDYKFYQDSYQPLVVAENIRSHGSVTGTMGENGLLYPDFLSWTRPAFPLLIDLFDIFLRDLEGSARLVSLVAGIATVPLAYLFLRAALRSRIAGLLGALLLAVSYNHSVWGGFIFADTTGVFFLTLTLWLVFRNLEKESEIANPWDLATGAAFCLAVMSRYEYVIMALPFFFLFWTSNPLPKMKRLGRLATIAASFCVIGAATYYFLAPFSLHSSSSASSQIAPLFFTGFGSWSLSGLRGFILSDTLLVLAAAFGIVLTFREKRERRLAVFSVVSAAMLGYFYFHINPDMQRYFIHLLPFILVPATVGLTHLVSIMKKDRESGAQVAERRPPHSPYWIAVLGALALVWQMETTYAGMRPLNNGLWFTPGYEELAAKLVAPVLPDKALIIASFPEPYFLYTGHPTQSIAEASPFVYIPDSLNGSTVVIIEDEGMRDVFPDFAAFLDKNLKKHIFKEIPLTAAYRYASKVETPSEAIRLYSIRLGELKDLIRTE